MKEIMRQLLAIVIMIVLLFIGILLGIAMCLMYAQSHPMLCFWIEIFALGLTLVWIIALKNFPKEKVKK